MTKPIIPLVEPSITCIVSNDIVGKLIWKSNPI